MFIILNISCRRRELWSTKKNEINRAEQNIVPKSTANSSVSVVIGTYCCDDLVGVFVNGIKEFEVPEYNNIL